MDMEECWKQKQDSLLQRHRDAKPNQREFYFHNISDELNGYQRRIVQIKGVA